MAAVHYPVVGPMMQAQPKEEGENTWFVNYIFLTLNLYISFYFIGLKCFLKLVQNLVQM
jgi:hypothetical protein